MHKNSHNRSINNFKPLFILLICALLLTNCSNHGGNKAQGYIEGRYTYIATSVSGILKDIFVVRGSLVKRGQQLFTLDPQPENDTYKASLENLNQSIASRNAIAANLEYAKLTYNRYKILVPKNAIDQSRLDNAKSIFNSTEAQLAQANANIAATTATLAQAKWTVEQKTTTAPLDALVFDTYYRIGEYTSAKTAILSLLAPSDIKAIFYISESDLSAMKLGAEVHIQCDGCRTSYPARISFISPQAEYTPPVIYSEQTNSKLIYRIEAEFKSQDAIHLHPGQPIIVTYQLNDHQS